MSIWETIKKFFLWLKAILEKIQVPSDEIEVPTKPIEPVPNKKTKKGFWIWWESALHPSYFEKAIAAKTGRIYLKIWDDASPVSFWQEQTDKIKMYVDAGIEVWGWSYNFTNGIIPNHVQFIARIKEAQNLGMTGFVFDLEAELKGNQTLTNAAEKLINEVKKSVSKPLTLGISTFDQVDMHPEFPYKLWKLVDCMLPQCYENLRGVKDGKEYIERINETIEKHRKIGITCPIYPVIGVEPKAPNNVSKEEAQKVLDAFEYASFYRIHEANEEVTTCLQVNYGGDPKGEKGEGETRILSKGMKGEDVRAVQKKLSEIGYAIEVDGDFGNETQEAVINFQRYNGIGQTGQVGPQTLKALMEAKPSERPSTSTGVLAAADIAEFEGRKNSVWNGLGSYAEKFLAPLRSAIGQPTGRYPWCGGFTYWCYREAGVAVPAAFSTGYTAAYVPGWETWARSKGYWHNGTPKRGDAVVYNWDGDAYGDHIGIVLSHNPSDGSIVAAEGNTSSGSVGSQTNGNSTAVRIRYKSVIKGYIRLG